MPIDVPEQPLYFCVRKKGETGVWWSSIDNQWTDAMGAAAVVPTKQRESYTLPEGGEFVPLYFGEGTD